MSTFTVAEGQYDWLYTSGTGVFPFGGGPGSYLGHVIFQTSGGASGASVSILDTVSGTAASGLWLAVSGVRFVLSELLFASGAPEAKPELVQLMLTETARSGWAIVISGGAANAVRVHAAYNS